MSFLVSFAEAWADYILLVDRIPQVDTRRVCSLVLRSLDVVCAYRVGARRRHRETDPLRASVLEKPRTRPEGCLAVAC